MATLLRMQWTWGRFGRFRAIRSGSASSSRRSAVTQAVLSDVLDELAGLRRAEQALTDELGRVAALIAALPLVSSTAGDALPAAAESVDLGGGSTAGAPTCGLAVQLFGQLRLVIDGAPCDLRVPNKALRVLVYLVVNHSRAVPMDALIDRFWPDASPEAGRRNLHQTVYTIRKALPSHYRQLIVFAHDAYRIDPALAVRTDAEAFEEQLGAAHRAANDGDAHAACAWYGAGLSLAHGEYLEELPYEDWVVEERERLGLVLSTAMHRYADLLEAAGDFAAALEVTSRLLRRDPCDEAGHRRAMRCYIALGRRGSAVRQYRLCRERLDEVYGVEPSAETTALHRAGGSTPRRPTDG